MFDFLDAQQKLIAIVNGLLTMFTGLGLIVFLIALIYGFVTKDHRYTIATGVGFVVGLVLSVIIGVIFGVGLIAISLS